MKYEKEFPIGLCVSKFDGDKDYTITGMLAREYRFRDFDGAYDFETYIQKHIDCKGIDFDSEYSQFFAYTKTKERAERFCVEAQEWFEGIKKLMA
jgi:hypothetical protein